MLSAAIAVSQSARRWRSIAISRPTGRSFRTASTPTSFIRARRPAGHPQGRPDDSLPRPIRSAQRTDHADRFVPPGEGRGNADARRSWSSSATVRFASTTTSRRNGDKDITFVGAVLEGRPSYYAHSSVYACPTTKASFGITLLESMACETPIVCSDILGFRDVVVDGREALMVPCGDRDALADCARARARRSGTARSSSAPPGGTNSLEYSLGACHVAASSTCIKRSRERRRRGMIVELRRRAVVLGGAAHGAFHRNSSVFGRPITRLAGASRSVGADVRRRPESGRDAAHPRRAQARAACTRRSSSSAGMPSGGPSS